MGRCVKYFLFSVLFFTGFVFHPACAADVSLTGGKASTSVNELKNAAGKNEDLAAKLKLSYEQKDFYEYIKKEEQKKLSVIAGKIRQKQDELAAVILSGYDYDIYVQKTGAILGEIKNYCDAAAKVRLGADEKLFAILDDKQKEIYRKLPGAKKANETQNHTAGAAAPVKEFKYGGCTGEAFGACKIEDLLKKEENKK